MVIDVKIYVEDGVELPVYATPGSSGMDIRAKSNITIEPMETELIKTGIYVQLPDGYEIQVRPRSGLSLKTMARIANSPGSVDSDFTGQVCVIMTNTSPTVSCTFAAGERIAQIVCQEVQKINWVQVNSVDEFVKTERGAGGFGSTGKH